MKNESTLSASLSIAEMAGIVRRSASLVIVIICVCELLAVLYLISTAPTYVTQAILAPQPAPGRETGGGASGSSPGGALAGAVALGMRETQSNDDFQKFAVLLDTPRMAQGVEDRLHIMKDYFPGWNPVDRKWERPALSITNALPRLAHWLLRRPVWRRPDATDLSTALNNMIVVTPDAGSGFLTISLNSHDPEKAQQLLQAIIDTTNELLRADARKRAQVQIEYLADQLKVVTNADEHLALANLLLSQEQALMLSSSGLPFAAQILSPPSTHFDQPKPGISLTLAVAAVAGFVIGVFVALGREALAHARAKQDASIYFSQEHVHSV